MCNRVVVVTQVINKVMAAFLGEVLSSFCDKKIVIKITTAVDPSVRNAVLEMLIKFYNWDISPSKFKMKVGEVNVLCISFVA